jgi:hypothetical protein
MWSDASREAAAEARKNGVHSTGVNKVPSKGTNWGSSMSDATWHASQPIDRYIGHITDLLGMWGGGGMKPSELSESEKAQVNDHYNKRTDPHVVAGSLRAQRITDANRVEQKYGQR